MGLDEIKYDGGINVDKSKATKRFPMNTLLYPLDARLNPDHQVIEHFSQSTSLTTREDLDLRSAKPHLYDSIKERIKYNKQQKK